MNNKERRRFPRFSADGLLVSMTSLRSGLSFSRAPELVPLDFNRHGIAIRSRHGFQVGEEVALVVSEEDGSTLSVNGVVRSRRMEGEDYRCGLAFDFERNRLHSDSDHSNPAETSLAELEAQFT